MYYFCIFSCKVGQVTWSMTLLETEFPYCVFYDALYILISKSCIWLFF